MSDVQRDLADLRDLVSNARAMPMSASAVVNRAEVLAAIDRIQQGWTEALRESNDVLAKRDQVLAEGQSAADEIVRLAELERERLASDTEVFRLAQRKADQVQAESEQESVQLRRDADDYIEQRFANFEHALERTLGEVRRGIANLSGRSAFNDDGSSGGGQIPGTPERTAAGPVAERDANRSGPDDVLLTGPDAG